jgi:hypothetical protein
VAQAPADAVTPRPRITLGNGAQAFRLNRSAAKRVSTLCGKQEFDAVRFAQDAIGAAGDRPVIFARCAQAGCVWQRRRTKCNLAKAGHLDK